MLDGGLENIAITNNGKGAKGGKANIGVGDSVTVKVRYIDENIREGGSRRMKKDLVVLYYLSHIASVLFLYHFWWFVPVLSISYRWLTLV